MPKRKREVSPPEPEKDHAHAVPVAIKRREVSPIPGVYILWSGRIYRQISSAVWQDVLSGEERMLTDTELTLAMPVRTYRKDPNPYGLQMRPETGWSVLNGDKWENLKVLTIRENEKKETTERDFVFQETGKTKGNPL